jgi:hypothetical protein
MAVALICSLTNKHQKVPYTPLKHIDKTQNSKQKLESVQDLIVLVNDMAVKGFRMTINDGTATSGNSPDSFHPDFFFRKPCIWAHQQRNNSEC